MTAPQRFPRRGRGKEKYLHIAGLFARIALAVAFLSAVADRFGWWGPLGTRNVAWGDFETFTVYVHQLAPYLPSGLASLAAWGATLTETVLGVALIVGVRLRHTAVASAATLLVFAVSMACFTGVQAPLNASVFSAAAAALLLASTPSGTWPFSLDEWRRNRTQRARSNTTTASERAAPRREPTRRVGRRAQS